MTDKPPSSASVSSTAANHVTGHRWRGLADRDPMPIANTMTASTMEAWVAVLPIGKEPSDTRANS